MTTSILSYTCVGVYLTIWMGYIAWAVCKRQPFPWDLVLALIVIALKSGAVEITGLSFNLAWLAFFPVMVWPESKPARYFIQLSQIGRSLRYGLLAGLGCVLFLIGIIGWERITNLPYSEWPSVLAFGILEGVLFEELAFRGLLLGALIFRGVTERTALLVQAVLFFIAHLPRYLPDSEWAFLALVAALGLGAGWITLRTRNIAGAVLMHLIINMSLMLLAYYF